MYGNELLKDVLRRTSGLLLVGVLAGCATDSNTTKIDESVKSKAAGRVSTLIQQKGAAMVLRVSYKAKPCDELNIFLQSVVDGRVVADKFQQVGTGVPME
jgi:Flp pilus assembly protein TadD